MDNIIKKFVDSQLKAEVEQRLELEKEQLKQNSPEFFNKENEKELKKALDKKKNAITNGLSDDYTVENWLTNILAITDFSKIDSFVPTPETEVLFEFLTLDYQCYETNYNSLTVMQAFKLRHPIINASLDKEPLLTIKIEEIGLALDNFNEGFIAFYQEFSEIISSNLLNREIIFEEIRNKVSSLAEKAEKSTTVGKATFCQITHAPKFSHPDAIYPRLFASQAFKQDGYLKTGNSNAIFDMHSGATELPICKLLYLKIEGETLLDHFKSGNLEIIQNLFNADEVTVKSWQEKFLCCANNQDKRTSSLIKQVYFPVPAAPDNTTTYHQLSLLFPSPLAFELKRRIAYNNYIDSNSFQGKTKRSTNKPFEGQYPEIIDLTLQRHGGTKPQNISALNNTHQNVHLLASTPPKLKGYAKELPTKAFLSSLWTKSYSNDFVGLHYALRAEKEENIAKRNNLINKFLATHSKHKQQLALAVTTDIAEVQPHHIKRLITICIENIMHRLIEWIWSIRGNQSGWSEAERFKALPLSDKILLDQKYQHSDDKEVYRNEEWLKKLIKEINVWIVSTYKEQVKKQQLPITSDHELIITRIVETHKEAVL